MAPKGEQSRYKTFTRRAALLGAGQGVLFGALLGRLYYLQIVKGAEFEEMAEENRVSLRLLPPPRGLIVDRNGALLAVNDKTYRALFIAEEAPDASRTLELLSRVIDLSPRERRVILEQAKRRRSFVPIKVRENLTWEQVARIEVNLLRLPGISIDAGLSRHYPYGPVMAQPLGYVGAVDEKELDGDPVLELPGFRIGKNGFEKQYETRLRGSAGTSTVEVNAYGRAKRELAREEGERGEQLTMSIDVDLQQYFMRALARHKAGAGVVMDCQTGEVLAIGSHPSFDSNAFARGLTAKEWNELVSNPLAPLTNKALSGQYHPGSVFKMVVALAALDAGEDPNEQIPCSGVHLVNEDRFHCWNRGGHGRMNLVDALAESCDVYFYEMAHRVGIDRIHAMARRLGMGVMSNIDLPNEISGLVPNKDWKYGTLGLRWKIGDTLVAGIGQGYVLTTPLQNALMVSRIVGGGIDLRPTTLLVEGGARPEFESLKLDPAHLAVVKTGMDMVVQGARGTARGSRLGLPGFEMGGKTGTAQVRRISKEERETGVRRNEELPWKERDHSLFVGYAPADDPRYVVSIVIPHGGSGSKVAAPVARDVMRETIRRDPSGVKGARNLAGVTDGLAGL